MCLDPVDIDDGTVTLTGNLVGDTATYTCDPGFELVGDAITTCTLEDGNSLSFQPEPPSCRCEYTDYKLPALEWATCHFQLHECRFHLGIIHINLALQQ